MPLVSECMDASVRPVQRRLFVGAQCLAHHFLHDNRQLGLPLSFPHDEALTFVFDSLVEVCRRNDPPSFNSPMKFSRAETICEVDEYQVELPDVTVLELTLAPNTSGGNARASLKSLRLSSLANAFFFSYSKKLPGPRVLEPGSFLTSVREVERFPPGILWAPW